MPEDLAHLDPETQQFHVKMRAAYLMTVGTALVLIFAGKPRGGSLRANPLHHRIHRNWSKLQFTFLGNNVYPARSWVRGECLDCGSLINFVGQQMKTSYSSRGYIWSKASTQQSQEPLFLHDPTNT